MRNIIKPYYYINRIIQKVSDYDFVLPFGSSKKVYVSNPPGGTLRFAERKKYSGDLGEIIKGLKPGDTYFDVGANFGHYSLAVEDQFDGEVEVHCFEPEYDAYRRLLQNRYINNAHWKCLNLALSDSSSWFRMTSGLGGYNHVTKEGTGQFVKSITLDEYIAEADVKKIDVMKIDVEGFELFVLKGLVKTLKSKSIGMIIFEVDGHQERYSVESDDEYKKLLEPLGYNLINSNDNYQIWKPQV